MGREQFLADVFVDLADASYGKAFDTAGYLQRFTTRCVQLLDVSAAAVLFAPPGEGLQPAAASEPDPAFADLLAIAALEGPAREGYRTISPVVSVDLLSTAPRWPAFTEQALAAGYRFASAVPLTHRRQADGCLLLLRTGSAPVPEQDVRLGQALAHVVAVSLCHQEALITYRRVNDQLRAALQSRIAIEQAKGFLAHRMGVSVDEAFEAMRGHARRRGRRLREVAREVVEQELIPDA
ncbi:GAF and ANTAR domain-containing protein [Streptomyces violens]|uniref:GAF and ANTAR domain-containing protein n=1 Tax=Streptomyces violens TaxID=66377 RepID=UPI0004BFF42F|nr:GAF and ANTAR domain-containing protein [Streptomyces violens]